MPVRGDPVDTRRNRPSACGHKSPPILGALRALAAVGEAEHAGAVAGALEDNDSSVADRAAQVRAVLERRLERSFDDLVED